MTTLSFGLESSFSPFLPYCYQDPNPRVGHQPYWAIKSTVAAIKAKLTRAKIDKSMPKDGNDDMVVAPGKTTLW